MNVNVLVNGNGIIRKKNASKKERKFEVIQVGKIWAVKNIKPSKILLYTEKKSDALKVMKDLVEGIA